MESFYSDTKNLEEVLMHWMSIFSEGNSPAVPLIRDDSGKVNVERTFGLTVYRDFPQSEKQLWLMHQTAAAA